MLSIGPIAFASPWLLLGLALLPALWWLLRLLPPAPRPINFPAIRLLFGLRGEETTPQAAPWWLILLRLAIASAAILAAARPILNPEWTLAGDGPVVVAIDDGWAAAPQWTERLDRADAILDMAARGGRSVYLVTVATPDNGAPLEPLRLMSASQAREITAALTPKPWMPDRQAATSALEALAAQGVDADVFWLSDGLDDGRTEEFAQALAALGPLTVMRPDLSLGPLLMTPPSEGEAAMTVRVRRSVADGERPVAVIGFAENGRPLLRRDAGFADGETDLTLTLDLPVDLRNSLARLELEDRASAGAVVLLDERWRRRAIGILADVGRREALPLLSETFFLSRALQPLGAVDRGDVGTLLRQPQSILLLPDETVLNADDADRLSDWIDAGGMLVRFAGPRLAGAVDDPLVPIKLRGGGRQLSGAMLWTEPARIGDVSEDGPFAGIALPDDVAVTRQVLAEPSLDLDDKTWMRLEDDTPLVTADRRGDGWLVLVHTTANTEWSNLALSGLFVDMLRRLSSLGRGVRDAAGASGLAEPFRTLDGFGRLGDPQNAARPIDVSSIADAPIAAASPPGFYGTQDVRAALNLGGRVSAPVSLDIVPDGAVVTDFARAEERPLAPYLLFAAFILLLADTVVTVVLRGYGLSGTRAVATAAAVVLVAATLSSPGSVQAQEPGIPVAATQTTLAYVKTGDPELDRISASGLRGLSEILRQRTSVEAGDPIGVDIGRDELAFYPLLYWPVTDDAPLLSAPAADRINRFMAGGGVLLLDTRDGHLAGSRMHASSEALRQLVRRLNIPPVAAVPPDHVLTRSFYLMQDFPGRWTGGTLWVETGQSVTNDGVSPVVVGDADWAAAWAVDESGRPMFPIGGDGERQRELAYRFGVNLVMYTLTGNYKSDQVHVPQILERLGQ